MICHVFYARARDFFKMPTIKRPTILFKSCRFDLEKTHYFRNCYLRIRYNNQGAIYCKNINDMALCFVPGLTTSS